jgi:hypothetical protein
MIHSDWIFLATDLGVGWDGGLEFLLQVLQSSSELADLDEDAAQGVFRLYAAISRACQDSEDPWTTAKHIR